jgi:hypothetical protein
LKAHHLVQSGKRVKSGTLKLPIIYPYKFHKFPFLPLPYLARFVPPKPQKSSIPAPKRPNLSFLSPSTPKFMFDSRETLGK